MQYVAVSCSVVQCVACVAECCMCCRVPLARVARPAFPWHLYVAVCRSVLQCVAVCCMCCSALQCVAVCCSHLSTESTESYLQFRRQAIQRRLHVEHTCSKVCPKSPIFCQKSPIFNSKSPVFCQKSPIFNQKSPILTKKHYLFRFVCMLRMYVQTELSYFRVISFSSLSVGIIDGYMHRLM